MRRPERLILLPLVVVTLLFILVGLFGFAVVFALITGLFALDFLRRATTGQEQDRSHPLTHNGELAKDYRLLGLEPGASQEKVRRVYKSLAAHFHPDTGAPLTEEQRRAAEEAFLRIREAHERIQKGFNRK